MPKEPEVFSATLVYVKAAYTILGVRDPPPFPLLIHGICSKSKNHPCVSELAEFCGLTMKTTSRTLGQIRKMGLIEVEIDPVDTRLKRVCFTKKGVEVERALYQNLLRLAKNINEIIAYQR